MPKSSMLHSSVRDGQLERVPLSEGFLIFDEVKVGVKVHYHAKTGRLIGLAMSSDELGSLHDATRPSFAEDELRAAISLGVYSIRFQYTRSLLHQR